MEYDLDQALFPCREYYQIYQCALPITFSTAKAAGTNQPHGGPQVVHLQARKLTFKGS